METTLKTLVIVGRPNVGKSLLFNRLLGRRPALVHNAPGMTLDYLRERLVFDDQTAVWLTDTGGVEGETDDWTAHIYRQMELAGKTADGFLMTVDAKTGCLPGDEQLARLLRRRFDAPLLLAVNKAENLSDTAACADFHALGIPSMHVVSAKEGHGLQSLRDAIRRRFSGDTDTDNGDSAPSVAIVGRPNVGKSLFINRLLKNKRMVVSDVAGTTRDAVSSELSHPTGKFRLIDTAGMRRRRADAEREKLSVSASRAALAKANAAILLFDLSVGVTYQDKRIAAMISAAGCSFVAVGNKADLLPTGERATRLKAAGAQLFPGDNIKAFAISALTQKSLPVATVLSALQKSLAAAKQHLSTAKLNQALASILARRAPKRCGAIRPKLRYAHQGGTAPLRIVLHGNAVDRIDSAYKRYLEKSFARELNMENTPIKVVFRTDDNPYV